MESLKEIFSIAEAKLKEEGHPTTASQVEEFRSKFPKEIQHLIPTIIMILMEESERINYDN